MTSDFYDYLDCRFSPEEFMGIFHTFFDESGKFKDHKIISFCGFGSKAGTLKDFDGDWEYQLRRTGMDALHMVDACRINKPLGRLIGAQSLPDRINDLKPFADCIRNHLELGVATVFEVEGYTSFTEMAKKALGGSDNPFYTQFLSTMQTVTDYVTTGEPITLMCDEDESTAWWCYKLYSRVKKVDRRIGRKLAAISFANDQHFPALQAADMLSFLCRLQANGEFYGVDYNFHPLFTYLTAPRGSSATYWQVAFKNKSQLSPLGATLDRHQRQREKGRKKRSSKVRRSSKNIDVGATGRNTKARQGMASQTSAKKAG